MSKSQSKRWIVASIFAIISIIITAQLLKVEVIREWGFDFTDILLIYFGVEGLISRCFKRLPPQWLCFLIATSLGILVEVSQLYNIDLVILPKGVFDPVDIFVFIIAGMVAFAIDTIFIRLNK